MGNKKNKKNKAGEEDDSTISVSCMPIEEAPLRKDIIGDAGKFVDNFIRSINSEGIYKSMGTSPDRSFLITGAPGNGKTVAIDALVNELNQNMKTELSKESQEKVSIPNLFGFKYSIGTHGSKYINQGCETVQTFFNECFLLARNGYKTLIVFDEGEVVFGKRGSSGSHKEDDKLLNTIMENMQTLNRTDNLYAVIMSNFKEVFDEASIRAGRVDRKFEFNNPMYHERTLAYEHAVKQINRKAEFEVIREYDSEQFASLSENFSYSDITESVNSAVKLKAEELSKETQGGKIKLDLWITGKQIKESISRHKKMFIKKEKRVGFQ